MKHQTEVFSRHLGELQTMLEKLLTERGSGRSLHKNFPITTDEQLVRINEEIKTGAKEAYVS